MNRQTARVCLVIEWDGDDEVDGRVYASDGPDPSCFEEFLESKIGDTFIPGTAISSVSVDFHRRPFLERPDELALLRMGQNILEFGGSFANRLYEAYVRADSTNRAKLQAEFWDLFVRYMPTDPDQESCSHEWNQSIEEADESGTGIYCLKCGKDGDA